MAANNTHQRHNMALAQVQELLQVGIQDRRSSVLQSMLTILSGPGLTTVVNDVLSCNDNREQLRKLGEHYISTVFLPMKASGGNTPRPSPSPLAAVAASVQNPEDWLGGSAHRPSTRSLESACLPRDGYRCVVTGHRSDKTPPALLPAGSGVVTTQTCHIIPLALAEYDESSAIAFSNAGSVWSSICGIFPGLEYRLADHLHKINHSTNLFTAFSAVHDLMGKFRAALEPVAGIDRYRVHIWGNTAVGIAGMPPNNGIVQLINRTANNTTPVSMPDPYFFETHYLVACILHASGLNEVLDETLDGYKSTRCLAEDGSTNLPYIIEVAH